jgi:hypothetical protein
MFDVYSYGPLGSLGAIVASPGELIGTCIVDERERYRVSWLARFKTWDFEGTSHANAKIAHPLFPMSVAYATTKSIWVRTVKGIAQGVVLEVRSELLTNERDAVTGEKCGLHLLIWPSRSSSCVAVQQFCKA